MSVTWPAGFRAAGMAAGIKGAGEDLALVHCPRGPATAAAVATTNAFKAASLQLSLRHLRAGAARAVLLNSGNANAINGREGMAITRRIVDGLAAQLACPAGEILFASTGKIGLRLPEETITRALPELVGRLDADGNAAAARAIMTTDRVPKEVARETEIHGRRGPVRLGGMAKGAGMIRPEMATMICVLTTDAVIAPGPLAAALRAAVQESFNMLTVDDDQSTNDFVVVLASGAAANHHLKEGSSEFHCFQSHLADCCRALARAIAADGEGAGRMFTVRVSGAWSAGDARRIARRIAGSNLVKTMIAGNNPNWGRVLAAAGSCGARVRPARVALEICGQPVFAGGEALPFPEAALAEKMKAPEVTIDLDLGAGGHAAEAWGCDLTEDYVAINREYS